MTKINVLSDILANKIAAGEVVEKTSSVVKELVENSIDAKAHTIKINLKDGGLKEIAIIDDGIGMDSEDALLAFSRHATSKIKKDEDLFFISSLGFRGEALPSIASVSETVLITGEGDVGTKIHFKGGKLLKQENSDARCGTIITVTNLFYNTPARLKFLKSESTELSHTVSLIEKLALANEHIAFTLTNNEKVIIKTSGSNNLLKTIHEIYGLDVSSNMLYLETHNDDFIVKGFVSKPTIQKNNRNDFTTFVNDRLVKNFDINRAVNDAYYTYKPSDKYPIVVLKIETDPTLIDVNIHPTKQDIKLSKINELNDLIYKGIKNLLYSNLLVPEVKVKVEDIEIKEEIKEEKVIVQKELDFSFNEETTVKEESIKDLVLYPVGLVHGTYIVAENEDGMYLIDQHAAAERIKYENYLSNLGEEQVITKTMMIPITIELLKSDYIKFIEKKDIFSNLGFIFEEFGINTIVIKGHPHYLLEGFEEEQTKKILDLIINMNKTFDKAKFQEKIAITLACKMSIKGNTKISMMEIEYFLSELVKCDNPYNCPHGRPTMVKYTNYELEKLFKRVM